MVARKGTLVNFKCLFEPENGSKIYFFNLPNHICRFWVGFFNQTPWLLWLLYLVFEVIKWIPARFGGYSHSLPSRFADEATRSKIEQKPRKMAEILNFWVFSTVAHWDTCFSSPQPVFRYFWTIQTMYFAKTKTNSNFIVFSWFSTNTTTPKKYFTQNPPRNLPKPGVGRSKRKKNFWKC
jgi:hypothetical protein